MTEKDPRIAEMLRLYSEEGLAYPAIGKRYGITRERVRQLLKPEQSSIDHDRRRRRRLEMRTALSASAQEEFDEWPGRAIQALLAEQVTTGEIVRRLAALGQHVSERQIGAFAARHQLPVRRAQEDNHSDTVVRLALLAAAAATNGAQVELADAVRLDSGELEDLAMNACTSLVEAQEAARLAGWARRHPMITITNRAYMKWRAAWLSRFPKQTQVPWPVTSQTIWRRLGDGVWNQAVRRAGIAPNSRGRTLGRLIYTGEDDYEQVMADFVAASVDAGVRPTGPEYELWAANRPVPSLTAVRLHFGRWARAQQAGLTRSGRDLPRRGAGRPALETDRLVMFQVERLDGLMAAASARLERAPSKREAALTIKETVRELTGDMVRSFESFRRRWLLAAIREDTGPFETKFRIEGAGSKEERRSWEAAQHRPAREIVEDVLEPGSLDSKLGAVGGDLRNDNGWLAPAQKGRLLVINPSESLRWRVLKAARNCLQHGEGRALLDFERALADLDPEIDAPLVVSGKPPDSETKVVRWLAAEVGAPAGYDPKSRLHRARLAHLHCMLRRVTVAMYSTGSPSGGLPER